MHQIVYTSKATDKLKASDLVSIVQASARNNPDRDVTGFLLYREGRFLQMIEGPKENLHSLIETLKKDPRHCDITIEHEKDADERFFPNWRMKRLPADRDDAISELSSQVEEKNSNGLAALVREFIG